MATLNLVDTTFTAKDIHTAISVYEYTVPAGGWYTLRFQVRLYQIAGGGDYTINLRLNDGDAQSDDPMVPKTTYTAAAGAQNIWFQSIDIDAQTGDVINIIVLGLAGDTAVTGSIRINALDAVGSTVYGRTADISATGEIGLDFANVNPASAPTTLTNITVPTVTTLSNAPIDSSGITTLLSRIIGTLATGTHSPQSGDAYARLGAPSGASISADIQTRSTLNATQVWAALTSGLTTPGSIGAWILDKLDVKVSSVSAGSIPTPAQIWNWPWRTTTIPSQSDVPVNTIQAYTYNTFYYPVQALNSLTNYTSIFFTVKESKKDGDAASILQISKRLDGVGDGLQVVLGQSAGDKTKGSITIDSVSDGNLTIAVDDSIMAQLKSGKYVADVKILRSSGVKSEMLREFTFLLNDTTTKAI